jgi:hypothetical protein
VGDEMKIGYLDPPYPGCAHLYKDHPDYAGEVDHGELIARANAEFDGWVLHSHVPAIPEMTATLAPQIANGEVRVCAWVKTFAAYKRNIPVAYAWEPVYIKAARKPVVSKRDVSRDWIDCPITLKKGLKGAKPVKVCHWAFERVAARPDDELIDLFPGTGAVALAWKLWQGLFTLPGEAA